MAPRPPGYLFHKATCKCHACAGKTQTLPIGAGGAETEKVDEKDVIHADTFLEDSTPKPLVGQDRTKRGRVREWLAYRALDPSITNNEVAEKLGITPHALSDYIRQGVKEGWLTFSDPLQRIEHEIIPQTIDNLAYFLKMKDKVVTVETAKGTIFKSFEKSHSITETPITVLALKIEGIDPATATVKAVTGQIVGRPRILDAEVEEVES